MQENKSLENLASTLLIIATIIAVALIIASRQEQQLNRIEANQIEIIENQWAIQQDSFHSNE